MPAGEELSYSGKKKTDKETIACPGRDGRMNNQLQKTGHNATWRHEKCSSFERYKLDIAKLEYVLRTLRAGVPSGVPRNFFREGGRVHQIQLRTEDRKNGDLGA